MNPDELKEKLENIAPEALPEPLRALADPARPLPGWAVPGYDPPPHKKLNMLRLGLWFTVSVSGLGFLFSFVINRDRTAFWAIVLGVCLLGLLFLSRREKAHAARGGDECRLGVYILPQGILRIAADKAGNRRADFLPRSRVTGFAFPEAEDPYAHTVIAVETAEGPWAAWGFPSVGMLHPYHKADLERWRETGAFAWERYRKPKAPTEGER